MFFFNSVKNNSFKTFKIRENYMWKEENEIGLVHLVCHLSTFLSNKTYSLLNCMFFKIWIGQFEIVFA